MVYIFYKTKNAIFLFCDNAIPKAYTINVLVTDRIAQKTEVINEYILRYFQFCAFARFAMCAFALLRNFHFCAILHNYDDFILRYCDIATLRYCDIVTLRYCDIALQIADRNVADSCRHAILRQSSHISNLLCALMIKLNDRIEN